MTKLATLKIKLRAAERKLDQLEASINALEKEWEETEAQIVELNYQVENYTMYKTLFHPA